MVAFEVIIDRSERYYYVGPSGEEPDTFSVTPVSSCDDCNSSDDCDCPTDCSLCPNSYTLAVNSFTGSSDCCGGFPYGSFVLNQVEKDMGQSGLDERKPAQHLSAVSQNSLNRSNYLRMSPIRGSG